MNAKILGAALIGAIIGGVAMSSVEIIKPAYAAGFSFVNRVMAVDNENLVYFRQEDAEAKVLCYTLMDRRGTAHGLSCVKKD